MNNNIGYNLNFKCIMINVKALESLINNFILL